MIKVFIHFASFLLCASGFPLDGALISSLIDLLVYVLFEDIDHFLLLKTLSGVEILEGVLWSCPFTLLCFYVAVCATLSLDTSSSFI